MTKTHYTDSVEPEPNKNHTIQAISQKTGIEKLLTTVDSNELSVTINNQYASHSILIFKLTGNMLQSTITGLRNSLHANKHQYTFLILDMREVKIISSAGWGLLISEQKKLNDERRFLFLADFQPDLQQVFESLQLHLMIQTFSTVTECLKYIHSEIKIKTSTKPPEHHPVIQSGFFQQQSNIETPSSTLPNDPMECIVDAISKHGPCSFFKLLSILQSDEYNKIRIGPLKLRSLLKEMGLDTFEKRLRYFRSC